MPRKPSIQIRMRRQIRAVVEEADAMTGSYHPNLMDRSSDRVKAVGKMLEQLVNVLPAGLLHHYWKKNDLDRLLEREADARQMRIGDD